MIDFLFLLASLMFTNYSGMGESSNSTRDFGPLCVILGILSFETLLSDTYVIISENLRILLSSARRPLSIPGTGCRVGRSQVMVAALLPCGFAFYAEDERKKAQTRRRTGFRGTSLLNLLLMKIVRVH